MPTYGPFRPHEGHPPHRCSAKGCRVYAEWERTATYEGDDQEDLFYCTPHKEYFESR